jgi:hypothetical protein
MEKGNTALVLAPFLDGLKQAGATVELFYSKKLKVKPCSGELSCWHKTPGRCYIQDDMQKLYPKLRQADILVLATPVYLPLPGEMQNIMNRLVPLIEPILEFKDNRTRAKIHKEVNIRKIALVSVCGWWELGNFETLLRIVEEVAKDVDCEFTGAVLRPHAYLMKRNSEKTKEVNDALKQCGFELIKNGIIKDNLVKIISQPLISEKEYTIALTKEYLEIKTD